MSTTVDPALPVVEHNGRTLDWRPRFDERSLDYRVGAGVTALPTAGRLWKHGPVLDQGAEGACVGFGCAGEAAAEPVPVSGITDRDALGWYRRAQRLDQRPGEAYSGTSVLAGCLAGRERGLWDGFRWAKSAEELAAGIARPASRGGGPAVIGVEWRQGSYETDALGVLRPSGPVVGGHCLLVLGFVPDHIGNVSATLQQQLKDADLWDGYLSVGGACFVILNSWGPSYGKQGLALVPVDAMRAWFRAGGEFAIPVGRALPKAAAAEPVAAEPATAGADETLHVRAWQLQDRDRIVEGVPAELGQETATVLSRRLVAGGSGDLVRVRCTAGVFTLRVSDPVAVRRAVA